MYYSVFGHVVSRNSPSMSDFYHFICIFRKVKSTKEKNVRQRKDYYNKRGTCWSRVYVYIRLDDITLPFAL